MASPSVRLLLTRSWPAGRFDAQNGSTWAFAVTLMLGAVVPASSANSTVHDGAATAGSQRAGGGAALGPPGFAVLLGNVGDLMWRADPATARAAYRQGLDILRRRLARGRTDAGAARDLARMLEMLGEGERTWGDPTAALAAYDASVAVRRRLGAMDAGPRSRHQLVHLLRQIDDLAGRSGDHARALVAATEIVQILRTIPRPEARGPMVQSALAAALERVGRLELVAGVSSGAIEAYRAALAIRRELSGVSPADSDARLLAASDQEALAAAEAAQDNEAALERARRRVETDKAEPEAQFELASRLVDRGELRLRLRDAPGSIAALREGVEILRRLAAEDAAARYPMAMALGRLGAAYLGAQDRAAAARALHEALGILRGLVAADGHDPDLQRASADVLQATGFVMASTDRAGAMAVFRESLAIRRQLAKRDGGDARSKRELGMALALISIAAPEPRPLLQEAHTILREFEKAGTLSAAEQRMLAYVASELRSPPR